jgi:signal transduction histidine kinase
MESDSTWWYDHIHPEDRERVVDSIHHVIDTKAEQHWHSEYRFLKSDDTYMVVHDRGFVVRDENKKAIRMIGAMENITERKVHEDDLKLAKEDADRANKMKSAFLANMSHEIRTPLGAMIGFTDLLRDPALTRTEQLNYLDILARNSEQLSLIINDILDISKVESGQLMPEYTQFQ